MKKLVLAAVAAAITLSAPAAHADHDRVVCALNQNQHCVGAAAPTDGDAAAVIGLATGLILGLAAQQRPRDRVIILNQRRAQPRPRITERWVYERRINRRSSSGWRSLCPPGRTQIVDIMRDGTAAIVCR